MKKCSCGKSFVDLIPIDDANIYINSKNVKKILDSKNGILYYICDKCNNKLDEFIFTEEYYENYF
jgi:hypothetical protein